MLRYGIPQYRLPKVEVLEAEYEAVWDLGVRLVANAELGVDFTRRRPAEPGLRRRPGGHRLLRHQQAGHPGRGRRRRHRRPGVPAHRHPGPALSRPRRQARRGHRRRLHLDGLLAHLGAPGLLGGDARLPPRHEGHAGRQRGPRDARGGRPRHLPGLADARRDGRDRQGQRRGVPAHGPGGAGRLRAAPAGGRGRHGVHHRLRPRPAGHRPGAGPALAGPRRRRACGPARADGWTPMP